MLFKTGPERNIITSPQKRYFFDTKEENLRIIENARFNLLFVPTLYDGYFNKEIPSTLAQFQVAH